jgi:hypothetical protein
MIHDAIGTAIARIALRLARMRSNELTEVTYADGELTVTLDGVTQTCPANVGELIVMAFSPNPCKYFNEHIKG